MINLMFCGNDKIYDGLLISLLSIVKYSKEPLNINVITVDLSDIDEKYTPITEEHRVELERVIKRANSQSEIKVIDISKQFREEMMEGKNMKTHYTPYIFLRLFADKIKELPDKLLYMDIDIVCYDDIAKIYNTDVLNYEFAAVKDYYGKWFIDFNYMNSGVLLMNLKKLKETNALSKCRQMCLEKKMLLPDQTALNKCCKFKMLLPRKYNEQKKRTEDTVVRHFSMTMKFIPYFKTINIKPWHIDQVHDVYKIYDYEDIIEEYKNIIRSNKND